MNCFKEIFVLNDEYPKQLIIDNKLYQRFLGCYLPCELYELTRQQLIELNQLRIKKGFVNWEYNKYIINLLFKKSIKNKDGGKILDFGIGDGFSFNVLKEYSKWKLYGIDIDGCSYPADNNSIILYYNWQLIKELNIKFDAIFSSFVFDFNVTEEDIINLYRYLNNDCRLVFNVYKFWDNGYHFDKILKYLKSAGFKYNVQRVDVPEQYQVQHKEDTIVVCIK